MILHSSFDEPRETMPDVPLSNADKVHQLAMQDGVKEAVVIESAIEELLRFCDFNIGNGRHIFRWEPYVIEACASRTMTCGGEARFFCEFQPDGSKGWCGEIQIFDKNEKLAWTYAYYDNQYRKARNAAILPVLKTRADLTRKLMQAGGRYLESKGALS